MKAKLKLFRCLLLLATTGLISACSVLDIATLDTATPLPAEKVKVGAYTALGLDLSSMLEDNDDNESEDGAYIMPVVGFDFDYGFDGKSELGGKVWTSLFNLGAQLHGKILVYNEGSHYVSVKPGLSVIGFPHFFAEWDDDLDAPYTAYGGLLQLLYTYQADDDFSLTAALRGNVSILQTRDSEGNIESEDLLYSFGPRANFTISLGPVALTPEAGVEVTTILYDDLTIIPAFGLGIRFKL